MMNLAPRFTNRRRILQLGKYALRHGTGVFDKLNHTNFFLARQFSTVHIVCNVCGQTSGVWYEMHSVRTCREHKVGLLRETLECLNCLSRMRYRIVAYGLLQECLRTFEIEADALEDLAPKIAALDILDTDAFSPISRVLSRAGGYKMSSFLPGMPPGKVEGQNLYNVDLQAMPFADETFDIILSSDVMEHVRDLPKAYAEILRCLKPGGAHIFTVPFDNCSAVTRIMINTESERDIYLEPPQIHGDDHLSGGIPAYRIFGLDAVDALRTSGFDASLLRVNVGANGIFNGLYFVARRPL